MKIKLKNNIISKKETIIVNEDNLPKYIKMLETQRKYILTIGIIGKNNEDTIEDCFKSLIPLREALPCQVIYTDTGSTDNTIEIAKKYADKILHFDWCNDFSAARNTAIDTADSVWFMWLDTDEYFQKDLSELINFFKSGEHRNYFSVTMIIKNFLTESRDIYSYANTSRIVLVNNKETRFIGTIHETIPLLRPSKTLDITLFHTGYILDNQEKVNNKQQRNIELILLSLEKNEYAHETSRLRDVYHLLKSYDVLAEYDKIIEYSDIGITYYNHTKDKFHSNKELYEAFEVYYYSLKVYKAYAHHRKNQLEEALESLEDLHDNNDAISFKMLDVYILKSFILNSMQDFEQNAQYAKNFVDFKLKWIDNKIDLTNVSIADMLFGSYNYVFSATMDVINFYIEDLEYEKALECFRIIDNTDDLTAFDRYIPQYIKAVYTLSIKAERPDILVQKYALHKDSEYISATFWGVIETGFAEKEKVDFDIVERLAKLDIDNNYIKYQKLRVAATKNKVFETQELISDLHEYVDLQANTAYYDILYYAFMYNSPATAQIIKKMGNTLCKQVSNITLVHEDALEVFCDYFLFKTKSEVPIWEVFLYLKIFEYMFLTGNEQKQMDIFEIFEGILPQFVKQMYTEEVLCEENIEVAPNLLQLGYYLDIASKCRYNNDTAGYVNALKSVVTCYPATKEVVNKLTQDITEELQKQNRISSEMLELSSKIKQSIHTLMEFGNYNECVSILDKFIVMIPNDEELLILRQKCADLGKTTQKNDGRILS